MFSLSSEDDEGSFGSAMHSGGPSKLASLFGQDRASFTGGNESLTYTAPKQPRKEKPASQTKGESPSLQFATTVHAYRYVNGQYVNQGKLGAAVLANHTASDYKLLLYVSKEKQVSVTRIHASFVFTVQANNYASFYDDQQQRWSVCFDSASSVIQFAKQVGLAMYNSSPTSLSCQDLVPGDGQTIEVGDSVEVKYTGWLWTHNSFGKVFDSNMETEKTFKFKTGKGKVIKGWDQGVIGMMKGSRRLIGIPSALAYGEKGAPPRVPPSSSLLFEVEVLRIKGKDSGANSRSGSTASLTQTVSQEPKAAQNSSPVAIATSTVAEPSSIETSSVTDSPIGSLESSSIKGRTASLSEHLSVSPEKGSNKARLLARMSKMGKNVLTIPGAVAADPEHDLDDSELVTSPLEDISSPEPASPASAVTESPSPAPVTYQANPEPIHKPKPHLPPRPVHPHPEVQQTLQQQTAPQPHPIQSHPNVSTGYPPQQLALYQAPQPVGYPMMLPQVFPQATYSYAQPAPQPPPPPAPTPASEAMVPVLMAESRQQQSEVRMAIGKVSDKIVELTHKVDKLSLPSGALVSPGMSPGYGGSAAMMDTTILLHNITRIVQENEKLKVESAEKRAKIEVLNEKISDLLQKNQRFFEQSNTMLEQRSDSLQHNTTQTQARVLTLEQEKITLSSEVTTVKTQLTSVQTELTALRQQDVELRMQMSKALSDSERYKYELAHAKDSHTENEEQAGRLKQDLKEERQNRKRCESRVEHIEEEVSDLRHEKESLEKSLADRKKKHSADKKKFEEELEEVKTQHEEEIQSLKERHRREKQNSGTVSQEQMAKFEAELEDRWKEKAGKMVSQTEDKWKSKYNEVVEEKEDITKKLSAVEEKYSSAKSGQSEKENALVELQERVRELEEIQDKYSKIMISQTDKDHYIEGLQTRIEELDTFQEKYQEMRTRTVQMKEQYEERLSKAEELQETAVEEAHKRGFADGKQQASGGADSESSVNVMDEVKQIMNNVYYVLRGEFNTEDNYTGAHVMAAVLKTIKEITIKSLASKPEDDEEESEEEEEEEEEEDEEEEEEDEEEEDEEKEEEVEKEKEEEENEEEEEEKQDEGGNEEIEVTNEDKIVKQKEQHIESEIAKEEEKKPDEGTKKDDADDRLEERALKSEEKSQTTTELEDSASNETSEITADKQELVSGENGATNGETTPSVEEICVPDLPDVLDESSPSQHVSSIESTPECLVQNTHSPEQTGNNSGLASEDAGDVSSLTLGDGPVQEVSEGTTETNGVEPEQTETETGKDSKLNDQEKKGQSNQEKPKSLFGDDHDDVEATFGPLKPKVEDREDLTPIKPTPPPLFGDDDDDDLDWLS